MGMSELQGLIKDAGNYHDQIEEKKVELQYLELQIEGMAQFTHFLEMKKDELDIEKQKIDEDNEELTKKVKVMEETAKKRIITRLAKNKNDEIKQLENTEVNQDEANKDFKHKHSVEVEKTDTLLKERLEKEEQRRLWRLELEQLNKKIED